MVEETELSLWEVTALSGVPLRITLTAGQANLALLSGHTWGVVGWWWWSVSPLPCSAVLLLLLPLRLSSFLLPSWWLPLSALSSCDLSHVPSSRCRHSPKEVVSSIWHCPRHGWASHQSHHGQASSALPVLLWPEWRNHRVSLLRVEPWAYGNSAERLLCKAAVSSRPLLFQLTLACSFHIIPISLPNTPGCLPGCHTPHPSPPKPPKPQFSSIPIKPYPISLLSLPTLSRVDTLWPPP